jgi:hypothetical protein
MPCDVRKMALLHSFHHISDPAPVMCATPFNVSAIADIMEKELWDDVTVRGEEDCAELTI